MGTRRVCSWGSGTARCCRATYGTGVQHGGCARSLRPPRTAPPPRRGEQPPDGHRINTHIAMTRERERCMHRHMFVCECLVTAKHSSLTLSLPSLSSPRHLLCEQRGLVTIICKLSRLKEKETGGCVHTGGLGSAVHWVQLGLLR